MPCLSLCPLTEGAPVTVRGTRLRRTSSRLGARARPVHRRIGEGHQASAMHEAGAVHMARLGAKRHERPTAVVDGFVEWAGALLERIGLAYLPPGELEGDSVSRRYR